MAKVLVINGPNLNMLGKREPGIYGNETLEDIETTIGAEAARLNIDIECFQSNAEHEIVDKIQASLTHPTDFIIINAGAFTHTSVAIRDALSAVSVPFIEVHISNVYQREAFRHQSYLSDIAVGVIAGLGTYGYVAALNTTAHILSKN